MAIAVVQDEDAVRGQVVADRLERLDGEEEGLQADVRRVAEQRERIGKREDDQVVVVRARSQERSSVVDVGVNARVQVGLVRVELLAQGQDRGIDLHRIDSRCPVSQGVGRIGPAACADDQDPFE